MKKKFYLSFAFIFVALIFFAVPLQANNVSFENRICNNICITEDYCIIEKLNAIDFGSNVEFFFLDDVMPQSMGMNYDFLTFDSIYEAEKFLHQLFNEFRTPFVFDIFIDKVMIEESIQRSAPIIIPSSNSVSVWSPLFTSLGLSWFNIYFTYNFMPSITPSLQGMQIINSWFTGFHVLTSWKHISGSARILGFGQRWQQNEVRAKGVFTQGVVINGQPIGFSTNEEFVGHLNASW